MIVSVEMARKFIDTELSDEQLQRKLVSLEHLIRRFTNNSFQLREIRSLSEISGERILTPPLFVGIGDTVQITQSLYNNGIYTVTEISMEGMSVSGTLLDCSSNLITKVCYPPDVVEGVLKMLRWEIENADKIGIQSEKLSRHSITYFNHEENSSFGFPKSVTGFLKPYMKARF